MLGFPILQLVVILAVATLCGTLDLFGQNAPTCKRVEGYLKETLVPPPTCTSPAGLCTVVQMFGNLKGQAWFLGSAELSDADVKALLQALGWTIPWS